MEALCNMLLFWSKRKECLTITKTLQLLLSNSVDSLYITNPSCFIVQAPDLALKYLLNSCHAEDNMICPERHRHEKKQFNKIDTWSKNCLDLGTYRRCSFSWWSITADALTTDFDASDSPSNFLTLSSTFSFSSSATLSSIVEVVKQYCLRPSQSGKIRHMPFFNSHKYYFL